MDWRFLQQKARDKAQEGGSSAASRPRRRVRQIALVAGVVAVVSVGAGAWYFSSQAGGASRNSTTNSRPSLASNALSTARDVGTFLRENVTRDVGNIAALLRRPGSDDLAEMSEDEDGLGLEAEEGSTAAPRTVRRRRREPTAPPEVHVGIESLPWAEVPLERPLFMVFDNSHSDVTPPGAGAIRLRSEFFPGEPLMATSDELEALSRPDLASDNVGLVEVVVSETGEVERAKLISAPANVHESMLLSAIKAWHFVPAEKGGQAVRYRQVMPITVAR